MKMQVFSPDMDTGSRRPQMSHDYWVRQDFLRAIENLGHTTVPTSSDVVPDIQIVLWGQEPRYKIKTEGKFRAVCLYSKPRSLPRFEIKPHYQVYTLTSIHQREVQKRGMKSKILPIASSKAYVPVTGPYKYDIAFMGMHKGYRGRLIELLAKQGYKIAIAGHYWRKIAKKYRNVSVLKRLWPNDDFSGFYNLAPISFYEVKDEYLKYGVVPIRIADIFRSSDCLCITRQNESLKEVFPVLPPTYSTDAELLNHIKFYWTHSRARREKQRNIREALGRTYEDVVTDIIGDAERFWGI